METDTELLRDPWAAKIDTEQGYWLVHQDAAREAPSKTRANGTQQSSRNMLICLGAGLYAVASNALAGKPEESGELMAGLALKSPMVLHGRT